MFVLMIQSLKLWCYFDHSGKEQEQIRICFCAIGDVLKLDLESFQTYLVKLAKNGFALLCGCEIREIKFCKSRFFVWPA